MLSTIACFLVVQLTCLGVPSQSEALSVPPSGFGTVQNTDERVDPHALFLLQQMDATYKSLQSFSTGFEEGTMRRSGHLSVSSNAQIAFRNPDYLAIATEAVIDRSSGPNKVFTDGKNAYLMLASKPHMYTELLIPSALETMGRLPFRPGGLWLYRLLEGLGIESGHSGWDLTSLSAKQGRFAGDVRVETITARWDSTRNASKDWEIYTFTIGSRDHLLYQASLQTSSDTSIHVARYLHPQSGTLLPDSIFALPSNAARLPLLRVIDVNEPTITLDKGNLDGVAVGDVLDVYTDTVEKQHVWTAQLVVTKTQEHTCEADLRNSIARLNNIGIIVKHKADPKGVKRKQGNNSWLWTPWKQ
ncbi:MAG: hypothetical protein JWL77_2702 [Chthonomonadaceae bacterium]|nr:hypothetical protein [Chthonomonadaceae bacterium]